MGGAVSAGETNAELVDNLVSAEYIKTGFVEKVFRAVDRGDYYLPEHRESAYKDLAWKHGNVHLSAPCIYAEVLESLQLGPGMSFLNLGSGTGYLSTMVGLIIGPYGVNDGVEYHADVIEYARSHLDSFLKHCESFDEFEFCPPRFVQGNCLLIAPTCRLYDRIYCGAACPSEHENYMKNLVKIGGILVMPLNDQVPPPRRLVKHMNIPAKVGGIRVMPLDDQIRRVTETSWETKNVLPVSFASLIPTPTRKLVNLLDELVELPNACPMSLLEICRVAIRRILRRNIQIENPSLGRKRPRVPRRKPEEKRRRINRLVPLQAGLIIHFGGEETGMDSDSDGDVEVRRRGHRRQEDEDEDEDDYQLRDQALDEYANELFSNRNTRRNHGSTDPMLEETALHGEDFPGIRFGAGLGRWWRTDYERAPAPRSREPPAGEQGDMGIETGSEEEEEEGEVVEDGGEGVDGERGRVNKMAEVQTCEEEPNKLSETTRNGQEHRHMNPFKQHGDDEQQHQQEQLYVDSKAHQLCDDHTEVFDSLMMEQGTVCPPLAVQTGAGVVCATRSTSACTDTTGSVAESYTSSGIGTCGSLDTATSYDSSSSPISRHMIGINAINNENGMAYDMVDKEGLEVNNGREADQRRTNELDNGNVVGECNGRKGAGFLFGGNGDGENEDVKGGEMDGRNGGREMLFAFDKDDVGYPADSNGRRLSPTKAKFARTERHVCKESLARSEPPEDKENGELERHVWRPLSKSEEDSLEYGEVVDFKRKLNAAMTSQRGLGEESAGTEMWRMEEGGSRGGEVGEGEREKEGEVEEAFEENSGLTYKTCMRTKVDLLPLPASLRSYILFYRN